MKTVLSILLTALLLLSGAAAALRTVLCVPSVCIRTYKIKQFTYNYSVH